MEEKREVDIYAEGQEETGSPLLEGMAYFSIDPSRRARMIAHPVENGQKIFDNKVIEPSHVRVECGVKKNDKDKIDTIKKMLENRAFSFYSIKAYDGVWNNMVLVSASQKQVGEKPFTIGYHLEFQEILLVTPKAAVPKDPADESTKQS